MFTKVREKLRSRQKDASIREADLIVEMADKKSEPTFEQLEQLQQQTGDRPEDILARIESGVPVYLQRKVHVEAMAKCQVAWDEASRLQTQIEAYDDELERLSAPIRAKMQSAADEKSRLERLAGLKSNHIRQLELDTANNFPFVESRKKELLPQQKDISARIDRCQRLVLNLPNEIQKLEAELSPIDGILAATGQVQDLAFKRTQTAKRIRKNEIVNRLRDAKEELKAVKRNLQQSQSDHSEIEAAGRKLRSKALQTWPTDD